MIRRIISGVLKRKGDEDDFTAACELVTAAVRAGPDESIDVDLLLDAAHVAKRLPLELGDLKRAAVFRYIHSLPEPQSSILQQRRNGLSSQQIAKRMGMTLEAVCRHLARMYADLNGIVRETSATRREFELP